MDVQGPDVARPYYEKHRVTFPRLVDQANRLGALFHFEAVPNLHVIDEAGLFRGANLTQEALEELLNEPVVVSRARPATPVTLAELARRAAQKPAQPAAVLAYADALREAKQTAEAVQQYEAVLALEDHCLPAYFGLSSAYLLSGDKVRAAETLKRARKLFAKNWLVRKQIWAVEHPERFYEGNVDYAWQKEQRAREEQE